MTKSELIKKIHHNNELNFVEVEKIVNEVLIEITKGLLEDGKVMMELILRLVRNCWLMVVIKFVLVLVKN